MDVYLLVGDGMKAKIRIRKGRVIDFGMWIWMHRSCGEIKMQDNSQGGHFRILV